MQIEQKPFHTLPPKRELSAVVRSLEPGQCLRLTTAREGRNIAGLSTPFKRAGLFLRTAIDGDDVLVWLEPRVGKPGSKRGKP